MKMKTNLLAASIAAVGLASAINVQADAFTDAMKGSTTEVSFRLRSETVNQDLASGATKDDSATANTLKTRLSYASGSLAGFSVVAEIDNVSALSETDYKDNSSTSSRNDANAQVIADHEYTDVNQAYAQYQGFDTTVKVGNQRILLDNQRHVGGVGFRQDEATFDAISVTNKSLPNTTIFAAAINNRHTITGGETLEDIELVNVNYKMSEALSATAYAYQISNLTPPNTAIDVDFETFGARFTGAAGPALYEAEFATQTKETPTAEFDTTYYNISLGAKFAGVTAKVGQEVMSSDDGGAAFSTPLGTNHAFNGWTDTFLGGIGNAGTVDTYANVATMVAGVKLVGQYHNYATDEGSEKAGNEFGFLVAKKFNNYGVSLKASQYQATDFAKANLSKVDTTKVWLTGEAKF